MKKCLAALIAFAVTASAYGHFTYIVPTKDGSKLQVIFSDTLDPDEKVSIDKIAATTLFSINLNGKQSPLKVTKGEHSLLCDAVSKDTVVVGGVTDYGFHQSKHTQNIPVWLKYYPKVVLGDLLAAEKVRLGDKAPLELVAVVREGKLGFQAIMNGKPLADAECGILVPGQESGMKSKTDSAGMIPGRFDKSGKYGARVSHFAKTPGEISGKKYEEIRHYATLVVDFAPTK